MLSLAIVGQDTLAAATAECCSDHFNVTEDAGVAELVWVCHDTPINKNDEPDSEWVMEEIKKLAESVGPTPLFLISSQMPVGTIARLEALFPAHHFACSPENIRVATAVQDFTAQARVVVGVRTAQHNELLQELFAPFTKQLIFTDPETAEMVKHALNCFLGLNIAYINEVARVCEKVGANAETISLALRTEARISPKAPLRAGKPFGGGHLARDIVTLNQIARDCGVSIPIIAHIKESNEVRRETPRWVGLGAR